MTDEIECYRRLWVDAFRLGIQDALRTKLRWSDAGSGGTSPLEHRLARQWVGSRDFVTTCLCAGFDPDAMADRIIPLLDAPAEEREAFLAQVFGDHRRAQKGRLARAREGAALPEGSARRQINPTSQNERRQ